MCIRDRGWPCHPWIGNQGLSTEVDPSPTKLLGYYYNPVTDTFYVDFQINLYSRKRGKAQGPNLGATEDPEAYIRACGPFTRRLALRVSNSVFCYTGNLLALQMSCRLCFRQALIYNPSCSWDQPLSDETIRLYAELFRNIRSCNGYSWDRNVLSPKGHVETDSHPQPVCIPDASLEAGAAKIFLITQIPGGGLFASLIYGKGQVANLRPQDDELLSVPRMELNAMFLGAVAIQTLLKSLELRIVQTYCLTDSEIAFKWCNMSPLYLEKYQANKVRVILSCFSKKDIYHIPSGENSTDFDSKYQATINPELLKKHKIPEWSKPMDCWPITRPHLHGTIKV